MDYGIKIFTGEPDQPYTVLGTVSAKQDDGNIEDVGHVLIEEAAKMGANAIINVTYQRKVSLFSFSQLNAVGTAVVLESDEVECPSCAELIKSKAKKCRFCGELV
jgi:energy-converting hydrogenase Eha subunit E